METKEMWIAADEQYVGKTQVEAMIDTIEDLISCYRRKVWYEDGYIKVCAGSYKVLGEIMDYLEGEFDIRFDGFNTDF